MLSPRVLRRRWVLALIFVCSLIYFVASIYKQSQFVPTENTEPEIIQRVPVPFHWPEESKDKDIDKQDTQHNINKTAITFKTCRNSVQGKTLIADDKGYVCARDQLMPGGCCPTEQTNTQRYVCDTCHKSGCCEIYEHCVSCCLQPEKQSLLRKILGQAQDSFQPLFASVTDHFELCLAKCRTSSQSVQHENSYRDPKAKFCYGENPPDVRPLGS